MYTFKQTNQKIDGKVKKERKLNRLIERLIGIERLVS